MEKTAVPNLDKVVGCAECGLSFPKKECSPELIDFFNGRKPERPWWVTRLTCPNCGLGWGLDETIGENAPFKHDPPPQRRDREMEKVQYYKIWHSADTTETGMFMRYTYIKAVGFGSHGINLLSDYCFKQFGNKTAYVQGVAPCTNWDVKKSTEEAFLEAKPIVWGGMKTSTARIELSMSDGGCFIERYVDDNGNKKCPECDECKTNFCGECGAAL